MGRRIETSAGVIIGTVDRVARRVTWALECPVCEEPIPLTDDQFAGKAPASCDCGWFAPVENTHATGDTPRYADYQNLAFETVPAKGTEAA